MSRSSRRLGRPDGVLVAVPFLFVGFDVIPQSAEEINLPFKQIGKLVVVSVAARGRLSTSWSC